MKNKYIFWKMLTFLLIGLFVLSSCSKKDDIQLEIKECKNTYSVGNPIDIEDHYISNVRSGITSKVCYKDEEEMIEKIISGNIYWPIVGGEHTFTISIGEKSISFSLNVGYRTPTITVDDSPLVYKVGSTVYFEDLIAVKTPNVYPSDATLKFKNVKYRTVNIDLEETISGWEDFDYDSKEECFDATKEGEYLITFEACLGDKTSESSFTVVAVKNKNDGNDNILIYNEKYASKNVIISKEDENIFRLPQSTDYTESSFIVLNHIFELGEEVSITFKGKNVPQIGMLVTPNEQSSNPFGLFSTKGHILSFEYKGNDRYVVMGPNGFNSNAVKTAVESRGEYWGWNDLDNNKYYRITAKLNKRNQTTNFVSYTVYEINDYGLETQSEKLFRSLDQSGWTASSDGEINSGYFVLYGSKNKSITFKVEYGEKQITDEIVINSVSYNKDGSTVIDQTCKNNIDNTIQGGYLAYINTYQLNTTLSFDFTGKNIPNVCFLADKINSSTSGDKGLYLSFDGSDITIYGPKRLISSELIKEQNSAFGRNNLVDGEHYRFTITIVSGGTYKVKFNLRLDKVDGNYLYGVKDTSLIVEYRSSNPKGSIIIYGTTTSRLQFRVNDPTNYIEPEINEEKLKFNESTIDVLRDSITKITLSGTLANIDNIVLRVADGDIATLLSEELKADKVGSTIVYAIVDGVIAECQLNVVEKLHFDKSELRIVIGEVGKQLILYGSQDKGDVTWTKNNDHLTISNDGVITAVSEGTTKVTAMVTSKYGIEVQECIITVALPVIYFEDRYIEIRLYDEKVLSLDYSTDKTITWSSSDEKVVTVNNSGTITAVGVGSATIAAVANNGETDSITINVIDIMHSATYNKATGEIKLEQDNSGTSYNDTSFVELGSYEDGAFVVIELTGKNMPQIAFFASEATNKLVESSINCLLFTSDVVTTDYRMFPHTNPNYGAVMANKWNKAATGNLDNNKEYVFIIGCTRDALKYYISLRLYEKNSDGSITLVDGGSFDTDYSVSDQYINISGDELIIYGSRNGTININVKVVSTLEQAESLYTKTK